MANFEDMLTTLGAGFYVMSFKVRYTVMTRIPLYRNCQFISGRDRI
jgi:hypothetical protein